MTCSLGVFQHSRPHVQEALAFGARGISITVIMMMMISMILVPPT